MTTPLYPIFRKRIADAFEQLIKNQVTPWAFLNSGKPFRINKFDNQQIAYEGIGFEGSPQTVFWSRYIEPFLEDICLSQISDAVTMAKERRVNGRDLLLEVQGLLMAGVAKTFAYMADIDRRLRGRGFPERIQPRSTCGEQQCMKAFIQEHIDSELAMWRQNMVVWYKNPKIVISIIAGVLVPLAIAYFQIDKSESKISAVSYGQNGGSTIGQIIMNMNNSVPVDALPILSPPQERLLSLVSKYQRQFAAYKLIVARKEGTLIFNGDPQKGEGINLIYELYGSNGPDNQLEFEKLVETMPSEYLRFLPETLWDSPFVVSVTEAGQKYLKDHHIQ